jgi:hypothetical protein
MRFDSRGSSVGIVLTVLAACAGLGCGGAEALPVGGPFGGTLDPAAIVDGGVVGDGDGVLDPGTSSNGSSATGSDAVPTWTQLYNTYFVLNAVGRCTNCHAQLMATATSSYSWLQSQGYIGGPTPELVDSTSSCLSWFGGNMPPGGPTNSASATKDFNAWAKAGAKNN